MTLVRIVARDFVAGLLHDGKRVRRAAPIIKWALGKAPGQVQAYCQRKGWDWQVLDEA